MEEVVCELRGYFSFENKCFFVYGINGFVQFFYEDRIVIMRVVVVIVVVVAVVLVGVIVVLVVVVIAMMVIIML